MSFVPALPLTGTAGWSFLKRTEAAQSAALARQPQIQRDEAYFRDRIATVRSAEDLVSDRRLLRISLEAFGLEADAGARAFVRKLLEDGTVSRGALANRLTDPRYGQFVAAFGFSDLPVPRTVLSGFADEILSRWKSQRFEAAVGAVDNDLRLAMNARRELAAIAGSSGSDTAKWLRIMGNVPLRRVVEGAFGLPQSFGRIDIDRQVSMLKDRARAVLGNDAAAQFRQPEAVEALVRRFLIVAEAGRTNPPSILPGGVLWRV